MLPPAHRLTDAETFRRTSRTGRRSSSRTLVVHLAALDSPALRVGFVVSKAVGNSVVRNRVKRRLRHLLRERLSALPASGALVVRALPAAGGASSEELGVDLDRCLQRVQPRDAT
ncbi:ribonuclease P protein component [Nocardioides sp. cx-169]|uniref:ribonuclease P protein component n=1 Tax=Nocardioides sp. cx-169 TaxID=2899080 RepID=UPI001E430D83|nr:ribonuclease P protein component [Nocardioides sp. cx-169]MCD4533119.1 ribonuclease P protein component [Nocardioides sp. cx-169]